MKTKTILFIAFVLVTMLFLVGCGSNTGYVPAGPGPSGGGGCGVGAPVDSVGDLVSGAETIDRSEL